MRSVGLVLAFLVIMTCFGCVQPLPNKGESPVTTPRTTTTQPTPTTSQSTTTPPSPTTSSPPANLCEPRDPAPTPTTLPTLISHHEGGLTRWEWDPASDMYENTSFAPRLGAWPSAGIRPIFAATSAYVYVLNTTHVLQYDHALQFVNSKAVENLYTIGAAEGRLIVAHGNKTDLYDEALTLRDSVSLDVYAGKHADFVLIHEDTAFIVDDVVMPFWMFRLDVSNPDDVVVLSKTNMTAGGSYGPQFLNTSLGVWAIRTSYSYMMANGTSTSGTSLHILGMDNGTVIGPGEGSGRALTPKDPSLAVYRSGQEALVSTAALTFKGFTYGCSLQLNVDSQSAWQNLHVTEHAGNGFVIAGTELRVVEARPDVTLVHSQALGEFSYNLHVIP